MIHWWAIPLITTSIAAIFLQWLSTQRQLPFCEMAVIGAGIVSGFFIAAVWAFCFILSLVH